MKLIKLTIPLMAMAASATPIENEVSEPASTSEIEAEVPFDLSNGVGIIHLAQKVNLIPAVDISEEIPQKDGSKAYLVNADRVLGIKSDNTFAYTTPKSREIVGFESFTEIEGYHCPLFIDALKEAIAGSDLELIQDLTDEGNVTALHRESKSVVIGECMKIDEQDLFTVIMYNTDMQKNLKEENQSIVTGL
ncbi:exported hypothetical protein [Vibrio chagasii]|nr:exported hypothetical protein [Vibrio chagasii]